MKKALTLFWTTVALASSPSFAQVKLTIQTDKPGAKIDRHIFGQFAEHLGTGIYGGLWVGTDSPIPNTRGIRNDVVAALRALKIPNLRWPGGCYADRYIWRDGIGPASARPKRINGTWGGVIESNAFGTHEFFDLVDQLGTEAYVSINLGAGTPREAADWVEYMTADGPTTIADQRRANGRAAPWKVKFLGIGNENWGCGGAMSGEVYASEMKRFATVIENYHPQQRDGAPNRDPMIRIAGGPNSGDPEYTDAIMKAWKGRLGYGWNIEGLSLHAYSFGKEGLGKAPAVGFGLAGYADLLQSAYKMETFVAQHSAIMDRTDPEKQLMLAVDEWGNWNAPMTGPDASTLRQESTLRDGISAAVTINIFSRHADRVRLANVAQMVNVLQAMVMTSGAKMHLTPTYHVFRMYVPFQDSAFVPVTMNAGTFKQGDITLPKLDAIAAIGRDGKLWLAITNVDPNAEEQVELTGYRVATGEVLTATKMDAANSFEQPEVVKPASYSVRATGSALTLKLPAKSVTVVALIK